MPWLPVATYFTTIAVGIVLGLIWNRRFLNLLRERYPTDFESLGSPHLFTWSPRKGIAIQRYIYGTSWERHHDMELERICRRLRVFTTTLIVAVVVSAAWMIAAAAQYAS